MLQIRKSPEVVQNVVTYTAIVSAPNPDLLLLPGMTAVLRIIMSDTGEILKVPNQALRYRPVGERPAEGRASTGSSGRVWAMNGRGAPVPVDVKLGVSDENSTQILDGELQEGQQLVVGVATPQSRITAFGLRLGF